MSMIPDCYRVETEQEDAGLRLRGKAVYVGTKHEYILSYSTVLAYVNISQEQRSSGSNRLLPALLAPECRVSRSFAGPAYPALCL